MRLRCAHITMHAALYGDIRDILLNGQRWRIFCLLTYFLHFKSRCRMLKDSLFFRSVADGLKSGAHLKPELFLEASVYFSDIEDFASFVSELSPLQRQSSLTYRTVIAVSETLMSTGETSKCIFFLKLRIRIFCLFFRILHLLF